MKLSAISLGVAASVLVGVWYMLDEDKRRQRRRALQRTVHKRLLRVAQECTGHEKELTDLNTHADRIEADCAANNGVKKKSAYYFFSSSGAKIKNKWDSFDDTVDDEADDSTAPTGPATAVELVRILKGIENSLEKLLRDELDAISADMANRRGALGLTPTLDRKRKLCVLRITKTLLPRCEQALVRAKTLLAAKRTAPAMTCSNKSSSSSSSSGGSSSTSSGSIAANDAEAPAAVAAVAAPPVRVPLTPEQIELAGGGSGGSSAWNDGGKTWETKDVTRWARPLLERHILAASAVVAAATPSKEAPATGGAEGPSFAGKISVERITDVSGEASMVTSRGKTKYFFEWSFHLHWALGPHPPAVDDSSIEDLVRGSCRIRHVSSVDLDNGEPLEVSSKTIQKNASGKSGSGHAAIDAAAVYAALDPALRASLVSFYTAFKASDGTSGGSSQKCGDSGKQ